MSGYSKNSEKKEMQLANLKSFERSHAPTAGLPSSWPPSAALFVKRGARSDLKNILWRAMPADWARHAGRTEIEAYPRRKIGSEKRE